MCIERGGARGIETEGGGGKRGAGVGVGTRWDGMRFL